MNGFNARDFAVYVNIAGGVAKSSKNVKLIMLPFC